MGASKLSNEIRTATAPHCGKSELDKPGLFINHAIKEYSKEKQMKKALIFMLLAILAGNLLALDILLKDGSKYSGQLSSAANGVIIITNGKVTISIPTPEIKIILDKDKDLTKELIGKAENVPQIDKHFVQHDDYFVYEEQLTNQEWIYVQLGKLITPATLETKNQAEFLLTQSGQKRWMKYWTKSRIASKEELKLGTAVICFDATDDEGIYRVPENTQEARSGVWFMARITDTSEMFKGYVLVSGGFKVSLNNLRITIK